MQDPNTCSHHDVYVTVLRLYPQQPIIGGRAFIVELLCRDCATRLKGQVQEVK